MNSSRRGGAWRHYGRTVATACLVACAAPSPEAALELEPCTIAGLSNCVAAGEVTFGGQPSPEALEYLAAQGYRTVISTRGEGELEWDERGVVESLGMRFVAIPMANPVSAISDDQVAQLDEALGTTAGPTLLHCSSGNRVAGLWGVWLAERRGIDPDTALQLAERAGMTRVREAVEARLGTTGAR